MNGRRAVRFISVAPPLDPFRLVLGLMEEVERTGEARSRCVIPPFSSCPSAIPFSEAQRTKSAALRGRERVKEPKRLTRESNRFVQRLSPVAGTSRADLKSVEALARELLPRWFASSSAQASLEGAEKGVTVS